MNTIKSLFTSVALIGLVACGGGGDEETALTLPTYTPPTDSSCADTTDVDVDWTKLLAANATKLSEYKLFKSQCNPTENPNSRGLIYDIPMPLFTDYATKYRFIFVPDGQTATYSDEEVFDFPDGSVLVKTFSMPASTDERGYENENILETRLLIKLPAGWVSRVYVWDENKLDATRERNGDTIITTLGHGDEITQFNYGVPDQGSCTRCHQFNPGGTLDVVAGVETETAYFSPIGPKARYLNHDYTYADSGTENQIQKWVDEGLLSTTGIPADKSTILTVPAFNDDMDVDTIPTGDLESYAKGWLDSNCSYCHRLEGEASNTAFKALYTLPWDGNEQEHGACQDPVSGAGGGGPDRVITAGNAEESLVYYRLIATNPTDQMPPLGRALVHTEGAALIKRWLDSISYSCN